MDDGWGYRDRFELPRGEDGTPLIYLCGHSLGPMPRAARAEIDAELEAWSHLGVEGWWKSTDPWLTSVERLGAATARIVGALPHEVVTMNALTVNLHLLFATFYPPTRDRSTIVMEAGAFPSDRYAVEAQVRQYGLDPAEAIVRLAPRPGEDLLRTEDIVAVIDQLGDELALVWLPGVQYLTGQRFDIAAITAAAHERGALAGWDLAHAAGNVSVALHDWDVDFAVWCTYKYLNSGPGGIGQAFIHERFATDVRLPRLGGWWGNDPATRMEMREPFEPRADAYGWLVSTPPILALSALRASLAVFDEVGMDAIRARSIALTAELEAQLDALGIGRIVTPREPEDRGAMLCLRLGPVARDLERRLAALGAIVDFREPDILRVAPAPLYNTLTEVQQFAVLLKEALG